MDRLPIFHKMTGKLHQQDLMRNIWCPFYEDCLDEAAMTNSLMDCKQCENSTIDFSEDWATRHYYCLLS
jgi:hypothetical protein